MSWSALDSYYYTGVLVFSGWLIYMSTGMGNSQAENMMNRFFHAMFQHHSGVYIKLVIIFKDNSGIFQKNHSTYFTGLFLADQIAHIFCASDKLLNYNISFFIPHNSLTFWRIQVADIFLLTAWIMPAALCVVMINSITYTFQEFYRYVDILKQRKDICRKRVLRDIRQKYLRLTEMSAKFDDISSLMLMFSYFIDIVMVCFLMRLVVFSFTELESRLMCGAWLCLPVFSLITLSRRASALFDEVCTFTYRMSFLIGS